MPSHDNRISSLERDTAKLELTARMDEIASARADFIIFGMRGDTKSQEALRPKMAEFAALEARAYAQEPAAALDEVDMARAEKDAEDILAKHGLSPKGTTSMNEPALGDPRSRAASVGAGDAGKVFSDQDASDEADRILRQHGMEPAVPAGTHQHWVRQCRTNRSR